MRDLDYLKLLAKEYPTVKAASSEIINLMAIRGLPKGTEYFFSDLHGEYEAFIHLLRSASGIIREKISETFGYVISDEEEIALANLIYYPERNIRRIQKEGKFTEDWQRITIYRLVRICKEVSSKFTRSKVRKKMPPAFAYIIDELLHVDYNDDNKKVYYDEIIHSIIDIEMGDQFIMALCNLIQNLTVDSLHIIGDIFDRGPRADIIMDELMHFHDVDIQWGNHDISCGRSHRQPGLHLQCAPDRRSATTDSTFLRTVTESISARCPCLRRRSTGMTRVSGSFRRFWMKISMSGRPRDLRRRCTRRSQ